MLYSPGLITTTTLVPIPLAGACPRSVECHQRSDPVHLGVGIGVAKIHALARLGAERGRLLALLTLPGARDEFVADPVTTLDILGGDYAAIVNREGTKSPKFKPTQENRDFLAFLQSRGLVRIGRPKPDGTLQIGRTLRR